MSEPISFGELEFNLVASMEEANATPDRETPFRLLVLGDFSGRGGRGVAESSAVLAGWRPVEVDRDNFEQVMRRLGVRVELPVAGAGQQPVTIRFEELEHFHPDQLFSRLEIFQALRQMRKRLGHSSTYADAAREVRSWSATGAGDERNARSKQPAAGETPRDEAEQPRPAGESNLSPGDLLEQMLSASPTASPSSSRSSSPEASGELRDFLREIVSPHLLSNDEGEQEELTGAVDAATGDLMRAILHHPHFQSLESSWRALYFLVSRVETDTNLKLYLLDISREELSADLRSSEDLRRTALHKLLAEQTVGTLGGEPWAVLAGDYTFDATRDDAELLGRIAKVARATGAPFIAGASPRLVGCDSLAATPDPDDWQATVGDAESAQAWSSLRRLPEAAYLGLALPRFILRLPYGAQTEPTDDFDFEEMPAAPRHEDYLWGNPAFACAYLLAEAFSRSEWDMSPGDVQQIENLPLHVYEEDGESLVKPCAETTMTERGVERLLDAGIMPLVSFRGLDEIRLARFQSLADPPTQLAGRWS